MDDSAILDVKPDIESFFNFFYELHSNVQNINCKQSHLLTNVTVYLIIDTLSKSVFPDNNTGNSERVHDFIKKYGNWLDGERVSLPRIARLIEIIPNSFSDELKTFTKSHMG